MSQEGRGCGPSCDRRTYGRGDETQGRCTEPCRGVLPRDVPECPGGKRSDGGTDLVGSENPAEDDRAVLTEQLAAQGDRRRHRGNPVEPVDDDKDDDRRLHRRRQQERQNEQSESAEGVVRGEQDARVEPVGQPAGRDGSDDVEDPDQGEQAGRNRLQHAVVVGARNEVGSDQTVGGCTADGESGDERPEGAVFARPHERSDGDLCGVAALRLVVGPALRCTVRRHTDIDRMIAYPDEHEWNDHERTSGHEQRCLPPAGVLDEKSDERQEGELAGRAARGQDADDEPAVLHEPAVGDGRRKNERHRPGTEPDEHAPGQHEHPGSRRENTQR